MIASQLYQGGYIDGIPRPGQDRGARVSTLSGDRISEPGRRTDLRADHRPGAGIQKRCASGTDGVEDDVGAEDGEGGQCSSCNGVPQLVPLSAELKLVQALQKRVHKQTKQYDQERSEQDPLTEEARAEAVKLSGSGTRVG